MPPSPRVIPRFTSIAALDPEMVGEVCTGETACEAVRVERQHGRIPLLPLCDEPVVNVLVAFLQICAFHRIMGYIEQEGVIEDLEIFPVAVTRGLLVIVLVAPEQLARH